MLDTRAHKYSYYLSQMIMRYKFHIKKILICISENEKSIVRLSIIPLLLITKKIVKRIFLFPLRFIIKK